jgi:hypothetical protein
MPGGKGEEISEKELTAWEARKKEGEDRQTVLKEYMGEFGRPPWKRMVSGD